MKHLLLLFICTVSLTVWGQETVPYTQTFDGPGLPSGWTTVDNIPNDPAQVWTVGTSVWSSKIPKLDGNYALINSEAYGEGNIQNADLISPVFNLSDYDKSDIILHFDHFFFYYWDPLGNMATLSYSVNNGPWVIIKTWNQSTSNVETFNQIIPDIDGQSNVRFKWNYVGEWAYGWAIDHVSLKVLESTTWLGYESTEWENIDNWDNGIPDGSKMVIINNIGELNSPTIQSDADCYDLNVLAAVTNPVIVSPGATLTVYNQLFNDETEGIRIQTSSTESGSLIANSRIGNGTETIELYVDLLPSPNDGWHYISTPVVQTIGDFLGNNEIIIPEKGEGIRAMAPYNTADDIWGDFFTNSTTGSMVTAKGYLVRTSGSDFITFTGEINNDPAGEIIPISMGGFGWNLIGNPYPSAINANKAADPNNFLTYNDGSFDPSYAALYVWDGEEPYYAINEASGSDYIGIGQGFFVKTKTNTTADFTPAMQVHQPTAVLKSGNVVPEFKLAVSNGKKSTSTSIKFFKDATPGLDRGYDAGILKADKAFSVFTHLVEDNDVEFTLQCLPFPKSDGMVIPVGIDCKAGGDVTISLSATTVPANYDLVLEDRLLNKFIPFNEANSFYNASLAAETKGIGRFYLHVKSAQTTGIDNPTDAKINAWMDRDEIVVKGVTESNAVAKLFDARGSLILMKNLENTSTNRIKVNGINTGIYMLQVVENGKRTTTKLQISGK